MKLDPRQYCLNEEEHQRIFEQRIKPNLFKAEVEAVENPVAVILGGQPGAGKSGILNAAFHELSQRGGAVQIVGDNFRKYHPQYAELQGIDDKTAAFYTDRDSGRWVEKTIDEAKARRVNIIIEGTMRNSDTIAKTVEKLRPDYKIDIRALAVPFRLSEQSIMLRYEGQKQDQGVGRWTTPEAHKAGYEGMPVTIERIEREYLADLLTIYTRGIVVIYHNELENGQWIRKPEARAVLESERNRPMNERERKEYAEGYEKVIALMKARNADVSELWPAIGRSFSTLPIGEP